MKKVVLVTGGARGIGRAIADDLSQDHQVAITYLTGHKEAEDFTSSSIDRLAVQADLIDSTAPEKIVAHVIERFGRIDKLVNNAGVVSETSHEEVDPEHHARMYQANVIAPAAMLAACLPFMQSGSAVLNIASVNAASPPATAGAYGASKAALVAMTIAQAKALGESGIRVNAIAPGAIERDYCPRPTDVQEMIRTDSALPRNGTTQDIAGPARFLLGDDAGFVTGETLTVSGGYRI
ncbi:SDR family NAD(P)-dependent oxidoreductase [Aliiroseovarius sp. 2305UL8-7]|uniref:SDR family NAD(P)-dependent oxidoreductase n=1 Tax=Aliiroseovarius conchicola TaxID=3121637 RepID=UPI003528F35C